MGILNTRIAQSFLAQFTFVHWSDRLGRGGGGGGRGYGGQLSRDPLPVCCAGHEAQYFPIGQWNISQQCSRRRFRDFVALVALVAKENKCWIWPTWNRPIDLCGTHPLSNALKAQKLASCSVTLQNAMKRATGLLYNFSHNTLKIGKITFTVKNKSVSGKSLPAKTATMVKQCTERKKKKVGL